MVIYDKLRNIQVVRSLVWHFRDVRSKFSYTSGSHNTVKISGIRISSKIQVAGNYNKINCLGGAVLKRANIFVQGNNNTVVVGANAFLEGASLHIEDNNCTIEIGEETFIGPSHLACTEDGSKLIIGNGCMISSHVQIRTGDSHSILDGEGNRINSAADVNIGNHVWLGEGCKILKGVSIAADSVVATGAIVTKPMPGNCLIAGCPGKVVKDNINWNSKRIKTANGKTNNYTITKIP